MICKHLPLLVLGTLFVILNSNSYAQESIKELPSGYYMTVAAYLATGEGYAQRYTNKLKAEGYAADYGFTYAKNMYFVYIKRYDDFNRAVREINPTRSSTPFVDAWVYAYKAKNLPPAKPSEPAAPAGTPPPAATPQAPPPAAEPQPVVEDSTVVTTPAAPVAEEEVVEPPKKIVPDGSRLVNFMALNARTHKPIDAIEAILYDPYNERVIATIKSGETTRVRPPWNKDKVMMVKTNTFGWKADAADFSFSHPVTDSTDYFLELANDTLMLTFEMQRLRRGDVQTLYHVFFISDAAIMKPVSRAELNDVVKMMKEFPEYRIRLHGHTNGSAPGSYTRLAEGDTVFFKMSRSHEAVNGSAKQLSYDRANAVKQYLVSQGIAADRIEVKGWGGKKMLYDENSAGAQRNIRVEVEVLKED